MKVIEQGGLRILVAEAGARLRTKGDETTHFPERIYLGKNDNPDNYEEVSEAEAERIQEQERLRMEEENTEDS